MKFRVVESPLGRLRKRKEWTQAYVAELLGISMWIYHQIEKGNSFNSTVLPKIFILESLFDCKLKIVKVEKEIKHKKLSGNNSWHMDHTSLAYLELLRQQIEKEDLYRIKPFRVPKRCERCNYRKGQTCLVPTCMKVAYVPRDYGVFKSEVS